MWVYKLLSISLIVLTLLFVILWLIRFMGIGSRAFRGVLKGIIRYFLPSSFVSIVVSGLCLMVQAPTYAIIVAFSASFIGTALILLGNDEDNDKFRKL